MLLKLRRAVQGAKSAGELDGLAGKMTEILTAIENALENDLVLGYVNRGDARMLIKRMYYLLRKLYDKYPEIKLDIT
jgi:hypothetical protein